jgi:nitrate/nitrite transporter NarK
MDRTASDAVARVRLAVALTVAGAIALVLPSIATAVESPSALVVASLAMAVAAMVHVGSGRRLALAFVPVRVHNSSEEVYVVRPGQATDPIHHPIRPRAPGQV